MVLNPFQPGFALHIETSHLICTGFYMECNTGLKCVNRDKCELMLTL